MGVFGGVVGGQAVVFTAAAHNTPKPLYPELTLNNLCLAQIRRKIDHYQSLAEKYSVEIFVSLFSLQMPLVSDLTKM